MRAVLRGHEHHKRLSEHGRHVAKDAAVVRVNEHKKRLAGEGAEVSRIETMEVSELESSYASI